MKNVLSKVGLDVHKEKVLLALITPHIPVDTAQRFNKDAAAFVCNNGVVEVSLLHV